MKRLLIIVINLGCFQVSAQQKQFLNSDSKILVVAGDVVTIKTDSAFVISKTTAQFLNQKLDELAEIQVLYNDIVDNRNELLDQLSNVQSQVSKLSNRLKNEQGKINGDLSTVLSGLDLALDDLKENNQALKANNTQLQAKIVQLENIVKDLRKEIRHIWWNGLTDKLVAFGVGVAAGALIVTIL